MNTIASDVSCIKINDLLLSDQSSRKLMSSRFVGLDGLRALACLTVLISHFEIIIDYKSPVLQFIKELFPAQLGIITFFCLSSFLMTNILINSFQRHGSINFKEFIIRRFLRIWPLYIFVITFTVILLSPFNTYDLIELSVTFQQWEWIKSNLWRYLIFIGNYWPDEIMPLGEFGVFWTICVEEQFYILLPLVMTFVLRSKKNGIGVGVFLIAVSYIWRYIFIYTEITSQPLYYLTLTYIDSFVLGAVIAILYGKGYRIKHTIIVFAMIALLLWLEFINGDSLWWSPYSYKTTLSYGICPLVISLLILSIANVKKKFSYLFGRSLLQTLGVLSFGVYLWHTLILRFIIIQVFKMNFTIIQPNEIIYWLLFIEYITACILMSALSFKFVELPFIRLRSRIYPSIENSSDKRWDIAISNIIIICLIVLLSIFGIFRYLDLF